MATTTLEKTATQLGENRHFEEIAINKMQSELDATGMLIRETGQLADKAGMFIRLKNSAGELLAGVVATPAENSRFQQLTQLPKDNLNNTIAITSVWLSPDARMSEVLPAILYLALRRGRIMGKTNVASLIPVPNTDLPMATLMRLERMSNVNNVVQEDAEWMPAAQRLKYAIYNLYEQCQGEELSMINRHLIDEVSEIHSAWLDRFFEGDWAKSVMNESMSKEQYIHSLFNMHQYVRQTTRLCARAVAHTEDMELRNHYINHFKGEINHEILIERDLKKLGADIEYLKKHYVPNPETKDFMTTQESTIGFYEDSVLMLACPMAAEGIAANMKKSFVNHLLGNIKHWGLDNPIDAARFLTSHINTDGGEDGHWQAVVNMIQKYITNEIQQQNFLSVLYSAMHNIEKSFNSNVEESLLWSRAQQNDG